MKSLPAFWQKDIINKLIVLISGSMILAALTLLIMVLVMPEDKSVKGMVYEYFPAADPTLKAQNALTSEAATAQAIPTATFTPMPPTITSLPTQPVQPTDLMTAAPEFAVPSPSPTITFASATPLPTATSTMVSVPTQKLDSACIPAGKMETGRTMEVLDGNTIRVMMQDGLVYTVRYIGIIPPTNVNFANAARYENVVLVYGKELRLFTGEDDKDERGRFLRYVKAGETFVNLELLQKGLAVVTDGGSKFSCLDVFKSAEQNARTAKTGVWVLPQSTPTP